MFAPLWSFRSFLYAAFLISACGGTGPASPSGTSPASPKAEPGPAGSAAALPAPPAPAHGGDVWRDDLSKDQKVAFMKKNVVPRLSKTFQAYDAKEFGDFSCKTCHGPAYKEPKDYLPKLTMKNGNLTAFTEHPAVAKFMAEKVVPDMANAMGLKPYDPQTHEGFGCGGCHTIQKQ